MANPGFEWTELYKAIADKIATATDGKQWIKEVVELLVPQKTGKASKNGNPIMTPDLLPESFYKSKDVKHEAGNLRDSYDPFSFFALFNYNDEKRIQILDALKEKIGVSEIPPLFHGIPSIYNSHVDYPHRAKDFNETLRPDVVTELWALFDAAMTYAASLNAKDRGEFVKKYDAVKDRYGSGWFTTTSILFEMRPNVFLPLDSKTRLFLLKYPDLQKEEWGKEERCILAGTAAPTGEQYLGIIKHVQNLLNDKKLGEGITTFPTLSHNAWKESLLLRTEDLLESSHQLILTGAPGTGKTYTAKLVAKRMITKGLSSDDEKKKAMDDRFQSVQFHPGYDYSDFVIGMKPVLVSPGSGKEVFTRTDGSRRYTTDNDKEDGVPEDFPPKGQSSKTEVSYKWKYGVFKKFADKARKAYDEARENPPRFVFFIDEINRADLSRVFGELFSLLEEEYRYENGNGTDFVQLPNGERFYIPKNLYIIGTMNDIDRSVESMDFALRRRFAWLEVVAEESKCIIEAKIETKKEEAGNKIVAKLEAAMDALNEYVRGEKELEFGGKDDRKKRKLTLGSEYELGGDYFSKFDGESDSDEAYKKLWDNHLKIILNEYLRGEKDKNAILDALYDAYLEACKVKKPKAD